MKSVYLFVHIEKTAGQTLRDHFIRHMRFHENFIHLGFYGERVARESGLLEFAQRSREQRANAEVVLGHFVDFETPHLIPGKKPRFVTFLREPAERMISLYNFTMHRVHEAHDLPIPRFEDWWSEGKRQSQVNWIVQKVLKKDPAGMSRDAIFELAVNALNAFWFVGTVATFERDTSYLMKYMGLPPVDAHARSNVSGVHFKRTVTLTAALLELITTELADDVALYNHFLRRRQTAIDPD
ncbi:MAG: sulfotransferase family 2 domain-containing protein [Dokdonella sp.]